MGTTMVPQNIRVKSMMSRLSNAVSHAWFRYLSVFVCSFEDSSFLRIFEAKNHIFVYTLKLNKIMNVSSFVSFDLGKLFRWSIRHWKAQIFKIQLIHVFRQNQRKYSLDKQIVCKNTFILMYRYDTLFQQCWPSVD